MVARGPRQEAPVWRAGHEPGRKGGNNETNVLSHTGRFPNVLRVSRIHCDVPGTLWDCLDSCGTTHSLCNPHPHPPQPGGPFSCCFHQDPLSWPVAPDCGQLFGVPCRGILTKLCPHIVCSLNRQILSTQGCCHPSKVRGGCCHCLNTTAFQSV